MIYFYISLVTYLFYTVIKYRETLLCLKQSKYDTKKYREKVFQNFSKFFITPELLILVLIFICLNFDLKVIEISTVIIYMILFLYKLKKQDKNFKVENKLILRSIITIIIYIGLNIWFYIDYKAYHSAQIIFDNTPLYYIILYVTTYLSYFVIWIVNIISKPFDKLLK